MMSILVPVAIMALGALILGAALGFAAIQFKTQGNPLAEQVNAVLPQTQCGQCGFAGCKPYAEAIIQGKAEINLCPPGGKEGVQRIAELLGRDCSRLKSVEETPKQRAKIDEQNCIGCTLCIQACPVEAIIGAAKQMHTVVSDICTGCALCIPPCPVECIDIQAIPIDKENWKWPYPVFLKENV